MSYRDATSSGCHRAAASCLTRKDIMQSTAHNSTITLQEVSSRLYVRVDETCHPYRKFTSRVWLEAVQQAAEEVHEADRQVDVSCGDHFTAVAPHKGDARVHQPFKQHMNLHSRNTNQHEQARIVLHDTQQQTHALHGCMQEDALLCYTL